MEPIKPIFIKLTVNEGRDILVIYSIPNIVPEPKPLIGSFTIEDLGTMDDNLQNIIVKEHLELLAYDWTSDDSY